MVQIIKGTFGFWNGRSVEPKTEKDGPISLDEELERRLVAQGVAEYVNTPPDKDAANTADNDNKSETESLPDYHADMKLIELKEIAAAYGVNASKMRSKAEVIAAIDAAAGDLPEDITADDIDTPVIEPEAPVDV